MSENQSLASRVAAHLLAIGAVTLSPDAPYTWSSGLKSPIYCDNRKTLSYPSVRAEIADGFAQIIRERYPDAKTIAGVATGGLAIAALIAERLNLPMVYTRGKAKEHGLTNQIEGVLAPNAKTVVIEDLVSTGGSSWQAVEALKSAGANVLGLVAIFTYGFPAAENLFQNGGVPFTSLSNLSALLETAVSNGKINAAQLNFVEQWRVDPKAWSAQFAEKS